MYSETAFLRDSELQLSLLHHYILFISDQHLWYDGCLHWNSLKAKKITLHWSVNIMNLYQGATQNMKLPLYLRMNILKTIPLWIQFNFSLSNNIIYISGWNLRYVTNHLIFRCDSISWAWSVGWSVILYKIDWISLKTTLKDYWWTILGPLKDFWPL